MQEYKNQIEAIWEDPSLLVNHKQLVFDVIEQIDKGQLRVAEKINGLWVVNDWVKKRYCSIFLAEIWRHLK